ncbi:MAG: hypothetical protein NVS3B10_16190 [Polyangiales bacterium]
MRAILMSVAEARKHTNPAPAGIVVLASPPGADDDGGGRKAKSARQLARRNKSSGGVDGPDGRPDES